MRAYINNNIVVFTLLVSFFASFNSFGQEKKPVKPRIKADFYNIVNQEAYLQIKATARVNRQNIGVANAELIIYNDLEEKVILGKTTTNHDGESKFLLRNFESIATDSTGVYNLQITFKGNDSFKAAKKSISFKNALIEAKLVEKDSSYFISATLRDVFTDEVVSGESLKVQVERLFRPLPVGEEFNFTDDNGTVLVPIEEGIPGVDGKLNLEVVLEESDDYGTVKTIVEAPIGTPIVDESTFDERTMWSPRNKTPIFLLIFPNLLIIGIWGLIVYLVSNLFKVTKS